MILKSLNLSNALPGIDWISWIIICSLLLFISASIIIGAWVLVVMLVVFTVVIFLAYNHPVLTISLTIMLGQIVQYELAPFLPPSISNLEVLGIGLRLADPLMFGIVLATFFRFIIGDRALKRLLFKDNIFFGPFFAFLFFEVIRNLTQYQINAVGEFRTYYQFLFFIPYLTAFCKTPTQRKRMLLVIMLLSLFHIVIGIIKGWRLFGLAVAVGNKWLTAIGSLSLLYGLCSSYLFMRYRVISLSKWLVFILYVTGISVVTISGNRSAWLAGVVGVVLLMLIGEVGLSNQVRLILVILFSFTVPFLIFQGQGWEPADFLSDRLRAFTDYQSDVTANWRYHFWREAIREGLAHPFLGSGFGKHFNIYIYEFNDLRTTSPHNLYVSMFYEIGIIGLLFYVLFVGYLVFQILRSRNSCRISITDNIILTLAVIVFGASHFYFIGYTFEKDFFTWLYLGLATSVVVHARRGLPHRRITPNGN